MRRPVLVEQTQKIYFISFLLGDLHYFQPREYLVSPNATNGCWSVQAVSTMLADACFLSPANLHQHYFWVDLNLNSAEFPLHRPNCQKCVGGGCCYNFGKLISSCTRCHNIQLKYYFPALPWPCCGRQPASEKALGWKTKLSAAHSVNGAVHSVVHRSRG